MFLSALVLAPLAAGAVAAHVLAERQAVRDADARLQHAALSVARCEQASIDRGIDSLTPRVARQALHASSRELERLRVERGLSFLLVTRHGQVVRAAMGDPEFRAGFAVSPARLQDLDGFAPDLLRIARITGTPFAVAGG